MTVKVRKLDKDQVPEEFTQYAEMAGEMNTMIEEDPTKEHEIRKVLSFGYQTENGIKSNFAIVEIDERFYQQAMMRILGKKK